MERITSRRNALVSHIRRLNASRACRREQGQFVCEGVKLVAEAVKWGMEIDVLAVEEGAALPQGLPAAVRTVAFSRDVMAAVSAVETPQGVLAVCRLPGREPPKRLEGRRYLILDGIQDPGNLGTIWRTADAFGADGLLLVNGCADPWGPKTVRATMGACFRLPAWETSLAAAAALARTAGLPLYATALREDTADVRTVELSACAAVIGSEGRGVSEEALALCDKTVKIPMGPRCESLNAAVAAAVVLWEGFR